MATQIDDTKAAHHCEDGLDPAVMLNDKAGVSSAVANEPDYDPKVVKRILRKVDWRLLPLIVGLHTISLIDRTNISVARISGMDEDLQLEKGSRASIVLLTFFIGYIACDIPSNIILRKLGAARFLGCITISWGLVTIGLGCVNSWVAAAVLRVLLGVFEAGNTPGSIFLVSAWYRQYEVQTRLGVYYLGSLALSSFSNILAYGIVQIAKHTSWKGWRWLFVVEGVMTCVMGIVALFFLIDFPDSKRDKFLTPEEKEIVLTRLAAERGVNEEHRVTFKSIGKALADWKIWVGCFMYMSSTMGAYAFSFFLPIILKKSMGFSQMLSFILSCPPALFAVVQAQIVCRLSDKFRMRAPFVVLQGLFGIVGLSMIGYLDKAAPRLVGAFIGMAGLNGLIPLTLAWQANNCREGNKRSVSSALQIMFGATGGIIASTIFRQQDAPDYVPGMTTLMSMCALCITVATVFAIIIRKLNSEADEGKRVLEGYEGFRYVW